MIRTSKEGQVPRGRCRRVALVFEAVCDLCGDTSVFTSPGAGGTAPHLRSIGWGTRSGRWRCARCMGRPVPNKDGLRLV